MTQSALKKQKLVAISLNPTCLMLFFCLPFKVATFKYKALDKQCLPEKVVNSAKNAESTVITGNSQHLGPYDGTHDFQVNTFDNNLP